MSKLEETLTRHPELSPEEATRIEVRKVSEPVMRDALLALVDLVEIHTRPMVKYIEDPALNEPVSFDEFTSGAKAIQDAWAADAILGWEDRLQAKAPTGVKVSLERCPNDDAYSLRAISPFGASESLVTGTMLDTVRDGDPASRAEAVFGILEVELDSLLRALPAPEPAPASTKTKSARPSR